VLKGRRSFLIKELAKEFKKGAKVSFVGRGKKVEAVVQYCNEKTIRVKDTEGHDWNVAPTFLKKL